MRTLLIGAALLAALPGTADAQPPARSAVSFENSGNAAAQPAFLRGLALLHNFEYPRAAAAFREAQAADPGFATAYWGEAMTYNHPVWMAQDADAARAVLARLASTPARRPTGRHGAQAWRSQRRMACSNAGGGAGASGGEEA